jgi:hypothetical protein
MDMLGFNVRVVPLGPFSGYLLPLGIVILPGGDIGLTNLTVQSAASNHMSSFTRSTR